MRPFALAMFVVAGCAGGDSVDADAVDTDTATVEPPDEVAGLPQGSWLVGLSIAPVGGLVVPLQFDLHATATATGAEFSRFDVRAVDGDEVSEILVSSPGVAVSADHGFTVTLPEFTLPAEYSITGSEVTVLAELSADTASADGFCGTLGGELVTFDIGLDGSTFGAIPWDDRADGAPTGCDDGPVEEIPRITDCPTLVDGVNTGFLSGDLPRSFEVALPTDYDPSGSHPLVFVYHGFGGTAQDMLASGILPVADPLGMIVISPQGEQLGETTGWDAFSDPLTNTDLVLFDDLVTCASESFAVDPDRIHVTGMSNGGLMTGYLAATRADVIASAAPMSGGVGVEPIASSYAMPALVIWGGAADFAFEQDFDLLATDMIDLFLTNGQFVVGCDHGLGHTLLPEFWPWTLAFLADHPRDPASEPYATGLPPSFPAYCTIR